MVNQIVKIQLTITRAIETEGIPTDLPNVRPVLYYDRKGSFAA
jgi:hypothetical protein